MISNLYWLAWVWCAANGVTIQPDAPPQWVWCDVIDGRGYRLTEWRVPGVAAPTDAQLRALQPAADRRASDAAYPAPDVTVPMLDSAGHAVGTARIVVDAATLDPVVVINSASPQRPWAEQRAAYMAALTALKAEKAALKAALVALAADTKLDKATKDAAAAAAAKTTAAAGVGK